MVLKYLTGGTGGNLNNPGDNFGADNDLIAVLYEPMPKTYTIFTLAGADLIDLQDANALNFHNVLSGSGRDTVLGGNGRESIYDQSGNDLYILRGGDDYYFSGTGNDTASGGGGADTIDFYLFHDDAGNVTYNTSGITCDLSKTGVQDFGLFGNDRITGFENLTGGNGADRLFGTSGANKLYGFDGNDLMVGRGGADHLFGAAGKDRLTGGAGADVFELFSLVAARDTVVYTRISDSGTGLAPGTIDRITFFDQGGLATDDRIDLSAIDARPGVAGNQAFVFRGTGSFTSPAGEVRLVEGGGNTLVMVDIDGDGASEMNILVQGVIGLTASDFIL